MSGLSGYNKYFYDKYCKNCDNDKNKDAEPTCLHLAEMMEGGKPPKECEKLKLLKARK
jgi:hypothetical protein